MERNHLDKDLLIKYLLQEVNTEEDALVTSWINADINNRKEFEAIEKLWLLTIAKKNWNDINVDEEWMKFRENADLNKTASTDEKPKQWQTNSNNETTSRHKIFKLVVTVAAAASVLLIVSFGWKFLTRNTVENTPTVAVENKITDTALTALHQEVNTTGRPKKVQLQDGTVIVLEDKSAISFFEPFEASRRAVTLQGKANFSVAKDKNRPFTVYSDAIATTVLGTVFDVTSYAQSKTITVRLYEGKVVVKAANTAQKKMKENVYLSPGYEMVYHKVNATTSVQKFGNVNSANTTVHHTETINPDNPNIPRKNGSWYMFNNQPLSQVFDQLKEMYHTEIVYNKKDVQKLYFIGQFNKADSLEMILDQITKANELKLTKTNNAFIISK